ncbi:MAG: hypothetical protein L3J07_01005 [Candidatus Magasanikbacteria bacterium]|nr:hypothetical protein [Candidatus Magasanikbacteria bacterium]
MTLENLKKFNLDEAKQIGTEIGINWETSLFDVEQFAEGLHVELEHGAHDPQTDVSGDDTKITGKIAWAHLKEFPDYYIRLEKMEEEAEAYWEEKNKENG